MTRSRSALLLTLLSSTALGSINTHDHSNCIHSKALKLHPSDLFDPEPITQTLSSSITPHPPSAFLNVTCLPPQEWDDDLLCVHTSKHFWHGRGISIFTNDVTHELLHSYPAILSPHSLPRLPPLAERPYEVRPTPGKGMSGYARKDIELGEIVIAEHPAMILHSPDDGRDDNEERSPYYEIMVDTLPNATAEAYLSLSWHAEAETIVDAIIGTNAFAVDIGLESHKAMFTDASRFNHDCRPNVDYSWSERDLTMTFRAIRKIKKGEEITISYIQTDQPAAVRKADLHYKWGFNCSCHFCTLPSLLTEQSDERMERIDEIMEEIEDLDEPITAEEMKSLMEEYIMLAEEERLHLKAAELYVAAAKRAARDTAMRKKEESVRSALNYTALALQTGTKIFGTDWWDFKEMSALQGSLMSQLSSQK